MEIRAVEPLIHTTAQIGRSGDTALIRDAADTEQQKGSRLESRSAFFDCRLDDASDPLLPGGGSLGVG